MRLYKKEKGGGDKRANTDNTLAFDAVHCKLVLGKK
jgi:hypothetical protein